MQNLIHNLYSLILAFIGLIGGLLWGYQSNWDFEPLILVCISVTQILAYFFLPKENAIVETLPILNTNINNTSGSNNIKTGSNNHNNIIDIQFLGLTDVAKSEIANKPEDDNMMIESKKNKISILFIDDDKNFNIVKILKVSGWKNTKTITDIKSLDDQNLKNSEIIFVDINGVGKILNLPNEGLDLALMIKQKYSTKKVIIYSANNNNNSFHEAWTVADSRLEKNALPYQFQRLVEKFSLEYYNN